jgi:hypothetical protein
MALRAGLIAGIATLVFAAPAVAGTSTTRYAEPGGDGPSPCAAADPCDIQVAVEDVAGLADVVVLLPGTYNLGADELQIGDGVDVIAGESAAETTLTSTAAVGVRILFASPNSSLVDVSIDHDSNDSQSAGLAVENGLAERVYVDSTGDSACTNIGLIRDSICVNSDPNIGNGVATVSASAATGTLRNVTAIALGTTSGNALFASATGAGDFTVTMHGRNVIAQGATVDQRGFDSNVNTAASVIDLDYSNFDTLEFLPPTGASGTGVGTLNNQSETPLLGPAYRQLPGSPTIDAGTGADAQLGALDIDLDQRFRGDAIDIGADEADGEEPETQITKKPPKRTRKRTARFEFSSPDADAAGFECKLDGKPYKPCNSGTVTYRKLKRKRHTFRVRAVDGFENADPSPATHSWRIKKRR